jgi:hypothetical protein
MIVITSVMEYLGESALCILFLLGLDYALTRYIYSDRSLFVNVSDENLRRALWFEIVLLAVWSICFKAVLYSTLRHSESHKLLAHSQSVPISLAAELLVLFLALVTMLRLTFRPTRSAELTGGDREAAASPSAAGE